jgi:uncharacterized protein YegL
MAKKVKKVTTTVTEEVVTTDEKTLIVSILDRSGSMSSIIEDAIGGFNEFLKNQKKLDDDASMSVVLFDDRYELLYNNVDLKEVKKLTRKEWSPRGMTALYDAIGKTINDVDSELSKLKKKKRPNKILVAIVTDGLENASTEFTHSDIQKLIKKKEKEDWQFVYLAANQNAFNNGTSLGISGGNTFTYSNTSVGNAVMFDSLSKATKTYRSVSTASANYSATVSNLFDGDENNLNEENDSIKFDGDIISNATFTTNPDSINFTTTTNFVEDEEEKED